MDGDDRIPAIVRSAEHLLDLARLHLLVECFEALRELTVDRFAGLRPFDEDRQVVAPLPERRDEVEILLDTPAALQNLLGFRLIFPEVRRGGSRLDAGQFFAGV
jgi:hypothetical protein